MTTERLVSQGNSTDVSLYCIQKAHFCITMRQLNDLIKKVMYSMTDHFDTLLDTLAVMTEALSSKNLSSWQKRVLFYQKYSSFFRRDFHRISFQADSRISEKMERLLEALAIDKIYWSRFIGAPLTVADFFKELHALIKDKNQLVLVEEIEQFILMKDKRHEQRLLVFTVVALVVCWITLPFFISKEGITLLTTLFSASVFFPAVGVLYTLAIGLYSFFQEKKTKNEGLLHRFQENFLLFLHTALNVAGYSLLIVAAVTMNPMAAVLFIAASLVSVFRDGFRLWQAARANIPCSSESTSEDAQEVLHLNVRFKHERQRLRKVLMYDLLSSMIITAIIVLWCFLPGGIFLSIGAFAAMACVYGIKSKAVSYLNKKAQHDLQIAFEALENHKPTKEITYSAITLGDEESQSLDKRHLPQSGRFFSPSTRSSNEEAPTGTGQSERLARAPRYT